MMDFNAQEFLQSQIAEAESDGVPLTAMRLRLVLRTLAEREAEHAIIDQLPKCWRPKDPICQCGSPMQPVEQMGLQPDWRCPACSEYVCSDLVRRELVQDVPVVPPGNYWLWRDWDWPLVTTEPHPVGVLSIEWDCEEWNIRVRNCTGFEWGICGDQLANSPEAAKALRKQKGRE